MKKTLLTALALMAAVSMSAAANGIQENTTTAPPAWGQGYGRGYAQNAPAYGNPPVIGEEKTITGTLKLEGTERPVIVSGDESYELMFPYYYGYNLDVKDGQKITVKGYEVPGYRWNNGGDEKYLRITEAEINGKEYKLSTPGTFGPGRGRMGGSPRGARGNRGGMGRGNMGGNWNNTPYNHPYGPYAYPYGGGARW